MRSAEQPADATDVYDEDARRTLHGIARDSIEQGLRSGVPLAPRPEDYPEPLRAIRASTVP